MATLPFSPKEVLLGVLVVDLVISSQEPWSHLTKLNMVIGMYFNEVDTSLPKAFSDFDPHIGRIRDELW